MKVEPLERSFGAKIYDLSLPDLEQEQIRDLYDLWLEYALLVFPGQNLTTDQQISFAKNFGALEFELTPISNVRNDGSIRDANDDFNSSTILFINLISTSVKSLFIYNTLKTKTFEYGLILFSYTYFHIELND